MYNTGYNTGYISLSPKGPTRLSGRKLFYVILGLFIGCSLTISLFKRHLSRKEKLYRDLLYHQKGHEGLERVEHEAEHHYHPHDERPSAAQLDHKGDATSFIPTEEWQPIPPGAILPQGLDIKVDLQTGQKMARKHHAKDGEDPSGLPVLVEASQKEKSMIELRLEQIISTDHEVQQQALETLEVEAHQYDVGGAITHAKNFSNLIKLLETGTPTVRSLAALIILGCAHNNPPAVDGILMSGLVPKFVKLLRQEVDHGMIKRIISILTFMSQANLPATMHQVVSAHGLEVINDIVDRFLTSDVMLYERSMAFLAVASSDPAQNYTQKVMAMLDKYLPKAKSFDEALSSMFTHTCKREIDHVPPTNYHNVVSFCKKFVK